MQLSFFINSQNTKLPLQDESFNVRSYCASLYEGDLKNDRIARYIKNIVIDDEKQLLTKLQNKIKNGCDNVYLIGFTHNFYKEVQSLKSQHLFTLSVVNNPDQRHPAAIVSVADHAKRTRSHHIHAGFIGGCDKKLNQSFCSTPVM